MFYIVFILIILFFIVFVINVYVLIKVGVYFIRYVENIVRGLKFFMVIIFFKVYVNKLF